MRVPWARSCARVRVRVCAFARVCARMRARVSARLCAFAHTGACMRAVRERTLACVSAHLRACARLRAAPQRFNQRSARTRAGSAAHRSEPLIRVAHPSRSSEPLIRVSHRLAALHQVAVAARAAGSPSNSAPESGSWARNSPRPQHRALKHQVHA